MESEITEISRKSIPLRLLPIIPKLPELPKIPEKISSFELIQIESIWKEIFCYFPERYTISIFSLVNKWFQFAVKHIVKITKLDMRYYPKLGSSSLSKFVSLKSLIISRNDQTKCDYKFGIITSIPNPINTYRNNYDSSVKQLT